MFEVLANLTEDGPNLAEFPTVWAAYERLTIMLERTIGRHQASGEYAADGSLTMPAWLRTNCHLSHRTASAVTARGKFLDSHPIVADAAADGRLSLGHVTAIQRNTGGKVADLFDTDHQTTLVAAIETLPVADAEHACKAWRIQAEALLDEPEPNEPERFLSIARTPDGTLHGTLNLDSAAATELETALATAGTWDGPDDKRTKCQRDADALFEICSWFNANHHRTGTPRHRPHIELIIHHNATSQTGTGQTGTGTNTGRTGFGSGQTGTGTGTGTGDSGAAYSGRGGGGRPGFAGDGQVDDARTKTGHRWTGQGGRSGSHQSARPGWDAWPVIDASAGDQTGWAGFSSAGEAFVLGGSPSAEGQHATHTTGWHPPGPQGLHDRLPGWSGREDGTPGRRQPDSDRQGCDSPRSGPPSCSGRGSETLGRDEPDADFRGRDRLDDGPPRWPDRGDDRTAPGQVEPPTQRAGAGADGRSVWCEVPGSMRAGTAMTVEGEPLSEGSTRAFLCDCVIHRVTASAGWPLEYGRAVRSIPRPLFRVVALRDGGCRFPGCCRKVAWCDGHHLVHWEDGGTTDPDNVALLCARHHHLIHQRGWTVTMDTHATLTVTNPHGTTTTSRPHGQLDWTSAGMQRTAVA